jgi:hypothetical protein
VGVLLLHGGDDPASPAGQRLTAFMRAPSQVGLLPGGCCSQQCTIASSVMNSLLWLAPRVTACVNFHLNAQAEGRICGVHRWRAQLLHGAGQRRCANSAHTVTPSDSFPLCERSS